jgi:hypothetical protein
VQALHWGWHEHLLDDYLGDGVAEHVQ